MKAKCRVFFVSIFSMQAIFGVTRFCVNDLSQGKVLVTKRIKSSHSLITFIKYRNSSYIIKQKLRAHSNFWSVMQALLADIFAHSIDTISSQRARMIPGNVNFPTKLHENTPASLLTIVPGKSIRLWNRTSPRQINNTTSKLLKHFFIKQSKGMNSSIIASITKHADLPHILALHVLLGFYDGHDGNIFYDQYLDHFSVIDMDSSFRKNLAEGSYLFIKKYFAKKRVPTAIKKALLTVSDTLELLMQKNPIKKIKNLTVEIANALTEDGNREQQFKKRIVQVESFLQKSYAAAKRLIYFIRNGKDYTNTRSKRAVA